MLKVTKKIDYISPSSYMKARNQPYTFYLSRLNDEVKMPREPQGLPAGDGSAFDYYVKRHLIEHLFPEKYEFLGSDLIKSVEPQNKNECFPMGNDIYKIYAQSGVLTKEKWADVELWDTFDYRGVPIHVRLDASVWKDGRQIAFDWKVSGSRSAASPKKYFFNSYKDAKDSWVGAHKEWYDGVPFELIDPKWALQMAIYNWKLGWSKDKWEDSYARLHMIAHSKKGARTIAMYDGVISAKFQEDLFKDIELLWNEIQTGTFTKRLKCGDINSCYDMAVDESWF